MEETADRTTLPGRSLPQITTCSRIAIPTTDCLSTNRQQSNLEAREKVRKSITQAKAAFKRPSDGSLGGYCMQSRYLELVEPKG